MFWGAGLTLSRCGRGLSQALSIQLLPRCQIVGSVLRDRVAGGAAGRSESFFQPGAGFLRMVIKWPQPAAVNDFPRLIDNVDTLGPAPVGEVGGFVHVVHAEGQREMEALDEIVGDGHALGQSLRLRVANVFVHIAFHLPFVLRMRFADVNGQKIRASFVIVVKIYEVAYLAAKGRSGVAAEDQNERALADAIAEMELRLAIEAHQRDVRSAVADVKVAAMPLRQRVAQEAVHIARAAHEMAEHAVNKDENYGQY